VDRSVIAGAVDAARLAGLPAEYALAVVSVESGGQQWAYNPEPRYRYLWDVAAGKPFRALTPAELASRFPPDDFRAPPGADPDAEYWGQSASWGLMQIMGAVARERGFRGQFLPALCDPLENLRIGCRVLFSCFERFGKAPAAIAAYNAGSPRYIDGTRNIDGPRTFVNQAYVDKVLKAAELWRAWLASESRGTRPAPLA